MAQFCADLRRARSEGSDIDLADLALVLAGRSVQLDVSPKGFVVDGSLVAGTTAETVGGWLDDGVQALVLDERLTAASLRGLVRASRSERPGLAVAEGDLPGVAVFLALTPSRAVPDPLPVRLDPKLDGSAARIAPQGEGDDAFAIRSVWRQALRTRDALAVVVHAAGTTGDDAIEAVVALVQRAVDAGDVDSVTDAVTALSELDAAVAAPIEAGIEGLLSSDEHLDRLVAWLDDPPRRGPTSTLLHMLSRLEPSRLLARIRLLATEEARLALAGVLKERGVDEEVLVDAARPSEPALFAVVARVACRSRREGAWSIIRRRGMQAMDPAVRLATLQALTRIDAQRLGQELYPLLEDPDPDVRRIARDLVVRRGDGHPSASLAVLLQRDRIELEEKKTVIAALGVSGGPEAVAALTEAVRSEREHDLKVASALALGNVGDGRTEEFLREQAGRMLVRRGLKDACLQGMERIRRRLDVRSGKDDAVSRLLAAVPLGSAAVVEAARRLVEEEPGFVHEASVELGTLIEQKDVSVGVFRAAILGLVTLRGETAGEILRQAYRRTRDVLSRRLVIWALTRTGDSDTQSFLRAELRRRSLPGEIRTAIKDALAHTETPAALEDDLGRFLSGDGAKGLSFLAEATGDALRTTATAVRDALDMSGAASGALVGTAVAAAEAVHTVMNAEENEAWEARRTRPPDQAETKRQRFHARAQKEQAARNAEATTTPTPVPVATPTPVPVAPPTPVPVAPPTPVPVALPTHAPVAPPTPVPSAAPTIPPPKPAATARPKRAPDFAHMFANYVHFEKAGRHVFGCRYGTDLLVDVHSYETPAIEEAYTRFFQDKIAEGFVPRTGERRPLAQTDLFAPLSEALLRTAYDGSMRMKS